MPDSSSTHPDGARPHTPGEAALWYASIFGWPVRPGYGWAADTGACACEATADCSSIGAHPAPGPWERAESAAPSLVRSVWRLCPGAPVLAVLGRPVPGAARLGVLDAPALVGAAALERIGKTPAAAGPITDGQGRIRFLVDVGASGGKHRFLDAWRAAGVDLRLAEDGYCALPTPGAVGRPAVVWAVPPDPRHRRLPLAELIEAVIDRAVRDAYPAMWNAPIGSGACDAL